jgi:hypothetical protein
MCPADLSQGTPIHDGLIGRAAAGVVPDPQLDKKGISAAFPPRSPISVEVAPMPWSRKVSLIENDNPDKANDLEQERVLRCSSVAIIPWSRKVSLIKKMTAPATIPSLNRLHFPLHRDHSLVEQAPLTAPPCSCARLVHLITSA